MDQAAELLIEEIAKGELDSVNSLLKLMPSDAQKDLSIPSSSIYIAGVLLLSKKYTLNTFKPPYSNEIQSQYQNLQKLYNEKLPNKDREIKVYQLSPRIIPTIDQLPLIQKDFNRKVQYLDKEAKSIAAKLISEDKTEKHSNSSRHAKMNCKKKYLVAARKQRAKSNNEDNQIDESVDMNDDKTSSPISESLQDLIKLQIITSDPGNEIPEEDGTWSIVSKKRNTVVTEKEGNERSTETKSNESALPDLVAKKSIICVSEIKNDMKDDSFATEPKRSLSKSNTETNLEKRDMSQDTSSNDHNILFESSKVQVDEQGIMKLQNRIKELELVLNEKDKEIRKTKETYDDQIQALQMRLYISETRLKTHQDALQQHIHTVASNTSN